ncbi:TonB-dependent receptor [Hyphomicrobium sp. D-2]|uniref:TonB-dependent receptor domain-containing protein n=1 Tax=Hyphomicrobium sp. D-2 TaxID=3041621 RepID=UPI002455BD60|nr:TonB-dependent receptor [Hyphomicrobium sp. D-2]MDH4982028.1 TonB-dependent receptor [Hyphomicrobium sp. D-2]
MAMLSVSLLALAPALQAQQLSAAQSNTISFNIPAQPLTSALSAFARQSGVKLAYPASLTAGKSAPALSGQYTRDAALSQLLSGSGLSFSFTAANVATISDPNSGADAGAAVDGAIALDTIDVSGGGIAGTSVYTPYETAAPTAHISAENIERFRGASPADMFRGTPGVMSGEARNGGAGIDVNIRGMQGFGRVSTTVDGAENSLTIYQGYQGLSNRSFVDPDLIGGVDITKGSDASSWGNAGSVAMRTINADDIVKDGNTWGVRVKGGFGTNTSGPTTGSRAGYLFNNPLSELNDPNARPGTATPSAAGMNRPNTFTPTSGSGSIAAAYKGENFDVVAGYAYREQGNYHAGTKGNDANPTNTGDRPFCYPDGTCPFFYRDFMVNGGLANYRAGEEVLNTQLRTESWLAKMNAKLSDEHTLQLGYTGFRSEAGDRMASSLGSIGTQAVQQKQTAGTALDTFTARHQWNPADNDLIQLNANAYWSHLELRNPMRLTNYAFVQKGLVAPNFRSGSDTDMWGGDLTNLSKFDFDFGKIDVTNGFSYRAEDTRGSRNSEAMDIIGARDAVRHEVAGFTKVAYTPLDWFTVHGGLRYSHFWMQDRFEPYSERGQIERGEIKMGYRTNDGGFSPSAGVIVKPMDGVELYANYSSTLRSPSIIEAGSAFTMVAQNGLVPERSNNWELGANLRRDGLLSTDDRGMVKLGYFNWDVQDYLARNLRIIDNNNVLQVDNIDRAKFEGVEFAGRYEYKGFSADLAANYFLNVEYCRTADTCGAGTLYGDYATNHVQPKYTVDLTVAQKLFEDTLTVGGRASYIGPRSIGHGDVTAVGASQFIAPIKWEPYVLVDLFSEYKLTDSLTASLRVENLFDKYYIDPLSLVAQPGPGRTFYASFTKTFGGDDTLPEVPSLFTHGEPDSTGRVDWGGLYAGFHAGAGLAHTWGTTTPTDGSSNAIAATESADMDFDSGMFGLQAGYNWQLGNGVVLGLEADWSKTYMQGRQMARSTEGTLATAGSLQALTAYDIDWTVSVRGRIGYAVSDRLMLYGTGGLSMLRETQTRQQYRSTNSPAYPLGKTTEAVGIETDTKNRFGFTVGGGAEYAVSEHWSIRADYGYTRFGSKSFSFEKAAAGAAAPSATPGAIIGYIRDDPRFSARCAAGTLPQSICDEPMRAPTIYDDGTANEVNGRSANNALDMHTLKLGINYRF